MNDDRLCVSCGKSPQEVPLIPFEFQDRKFWICPQHLPILIHDPQALAGKLPGAEAMTPPAKKH